MHHNPYFSPFCLLFIMQVFSSLYPRCHAKPDLHSLNEAALRSYDSLLKYIATAHTPTTVVQLQNEILHFFNTTISNAQQSVHPAQAAASVSSSLTCCLHEHECHVTINLMDLLLQTATPQLALPTSVGTCNTTLRGTREEAHPMISAPARGCPAACHNRHTLLQAAARRNSEHRNSGHRQRRACL